MRAFVVDTFTDTAFAGNPAGVVLLDSSADPAWMQSVATELRHSETAFVEVGGPAGEPKPLRWFTPTTEVPLCGHATLATAHVLGGDQRFDTRSGILTCTALSDGWIGMDFPADRAELVEQPEGIAAGLPGITVEATAQATTKILVQAASADEVRAVRPDFAALATVPSRGVIITAPGDRPGIDFVSRVFSPQVGIQEDPVTGSAHCTLATWWAERLHRDPRDADFVGEQASARGGTVRMALRGDRVDLRGQAVTILTGNLQA